MKNKILVTGSTGTIGTSLVEYLDEMNADFTAMVKNSDMADNLNKRGIRTVIADFENIESLQNAVKGIQIVFLLSPSSPDMPEMQKNFVKVAWENNVQHIVKLAARGSDVDADFNIGKWHGTIEEEIRKSGMEYTFLHAHSFMQNLFFDAETIKQENAIYSSQGEGKIPMVDTRDIAAVAARVLIDGGHHGKTYLLTGPKPISYHDIANALSELLGRKIEYVAQSPEESEKAMLESGMPEWLVDDMVLLNKRYARNEAAEVSPDIELITGRKATPLETFLKDYQYKFV
jgi:uncharacterized protein YbjT (DUF2867 family)